jgi:predicted flap endonuclease-1-like 5' DNA nuclease
VLVLGSAAPELPLTPQAPVEAKHVAIPPAAREPASAKPDPRSRVTKHPLTPFEPAPAKSGATKHAAVTRKPLKPARDAEPAKPTRSAAPKPAPVPAQSTRSTQPVKSSATKRGVGTPATTPHPAWDSLAGLPGLGPKTAAKLVAQGFASCHDLARWIPASYRDQRRRDLAQDGAEVIVEATVRRFRQSFFRGRYVAAMELVQDTVDGPRPFVARWFHRAAGPRAPRVRRRDQGRAPPRVCRRSTASPSAPASASGRPRALAAIDDEIATAIWTWPSGQDDVGPSGHVGDLEATRVRAVLVRGRAREQQTKAGNASLEHAQAELHDDHVREEARLGQAAVDHPRWHLGGHLLREAAAAAIDLGHVADDDETRRDVVEAVCDLLADLLLGLLAALAHALGLGEHVPPLLAGQMRRQASTARVRLRRLRPGRGRSVGGLVGLALVLLRKLLLAELLERLAQRVRVDLLRAAPWTRRVSSDASISTAATPSVLGALRPVHAELGPTRPPSRDLLMKITDRKKPASSTTARSCPRFASFAHAGLDQANSNRLPQPGSSWPGATKKISFRPARTPIPPGE